MVSPTIETAHHMRVAVGELPPDLVLRNGRVLDVFTGTVERTSIAIFEGRIVGLGDYAAPDEVDLDGLFVIPGLIDGHIHVESTFLTPAELARAVVPHGTSALVADPHELANVMGMAGVHALLDASADLPLDIFVMAPACVPASGLQPAGASVTAKDLEAVADHPRVLGLGEVMDQASLFAYDRELLAKLRLFAGRPIDGHAPLIGARRLDAYVIAGPQSDHECESRNEARARLQRGMWLMIREGSSAQNLEALLPLVTPATERRCMLVSDDRLPDGLAREGHLDLLLRRVVAEGLDPVTAVRLVTLNPAERFGLTDRGAIAPGRRADLVLVDDLRRFDVAAVYHGGERVALGGHLTKHLERTFSSAARGRMRVPQLDERALECEVMGPFVRVIEAQPDRLLTSWGVESTPQRGGLLAASPARDMARLVVLERHHGTGERGFGVVRGLGMHDGALATSFAHDAHQLVVAGVDTPSMFAAAQWVVDAGGGLAVARDGAVLAGLALPYAGLLSDQSLGVVLEKLDALGAASSRLCEHPAPFATLSFLSLEVVPHLRLTMHGLVDVTTREHVALFMQR